MGADQVSRRYAGAWLAAAKDKGGLKAAAGDADSLQSMLTSSADFRAFIASPLVSQTDQDKALAEIAKKANFNASTVSFLSTLVDNRRLNALPGILEAFRELLSAEAGEVQATVTSATKLDDKKVVDISAQISKKLGKNVQVQTNVDPSLIGGLVIRVGSTMIDDSIKTKLDRLQRRLQAGSAA
ncbi:MAG TPA: F0F1 ATP synthase subunit delta [Alphaproteobacteria bacterium]